MECMLLMEEKEEAKLLNICKETKLKFLAVAALFGKKTFPPETFLFSFFYCKNVIFEKVSSIQTATQ